MLVVTPKPEPSESLVGYVIRLTEVNAYDTPGRVLCYAGYPTSQALTFSCDLEPLANIVGHSPDDWAKIAYGNAQSRKRQPIRFGNHVISEARPFRVLTPKRTSVCPQCIDEIGYLDRFWDLTLATCCPIHGRKAIHVCPSCDKPISWLRPGLLKCRCGASLIKVVPQFAGRGEIELVRLLKAKYENHSLLSLQNREKFPVKFLARLSLDQFSTLVFVLGQNLQGLTGAEALKNPYAVLGAATSALRQWPQGFHDTLERMRENSNVHVNVRRYARDIFGVLYRKLSGKKDARDGSAFIVAEFNRFLQKTFARPLLEEIRINTSTRVRLSKHMTHDWVCKRFAISRKKVEGWCRFNNVDHDKITQEQLLRFITEVYIVSYLNVASERRVSKRKAAAIVGIPVDTLVGLAKLGYFGSDVSGQTGVSFGMADIERLAERLQAVGNCARTEAINDRDHMSLARLLETTCFWSETAKAEFLIELMNRQIMPAGRTGASTQGLYFKRTQIDRYVRDKRDDRANGLTTMIDAAFEIDCTPVAVGELIRLGYFDTYDGPYYRNLSQSQVSSFASKYVSLGKLANDIGTLPRFLRPQAEADGIVAISIECDKGYQIDFIHRRDAAAFQERIEKIREQKKREQNARPRVLTNQEKLKQYFDRLRNERLPLPRTGKRPTLRTIAREAGFERNSFYACAKLKLLLTNFEKEDAKAQGIDSRPDLEILESRLQKIIDHGDIDEIQSYAGLGKQALANRLSIGRQVFYENKKAPRVLRRFHKVAKALLRKRKTGATNKPRASKRRARRRSHDR